MPIKEVVSEIFKKIAIFFSFKKRLEIEPRSIEIDKIIKLESELDAYVNKLVNLMPKIGEARTSILSTLGEKIERIDKNSNEMAEKVEKMRIVPDISEDELKIIEKIKKLKDELRNMDLESVDKYKLGLEAAILFSEADKLPIKSDDEIREHHKKAEEIKELVEHIAPAVLEKSINERIEEIEKNINARINGLARKAITDLDSKLINEFRLRALYLRGLSEYKRGKYENALKNFDEIIKINPRSQEVWLNKGAVLGKLGHYKEEIECYNEALRIEEKYSDAWINKGIALIECGEDEVAEVCFKKAYEVSSTKQEVR